ncbi:MAG: response regulator [candidate division WOR-3 bacterium]
MVNKQVNVLLVEDNKDHQRLLQVYLENTNINLDVANNARELMAKLKGPVKYKIILLDIQLPRIDGYTLASKIRKKNKDIIIIGLSAFAMKSDRTKAQAVGMNDYLTKPLDKKLFLAVLNKYLK